MDEFGTAFSAVAISDINKKRKGGLKMSKKKLTALFLSAAMVCSLAACGDQADSSAQKESEQSSSQSSASAEEEKESEESQESGEEVSAQVPDLGTLTVINMGSEPDFDLEADYYPVLDSYTEKWGMKLRIQYVAWGEEGTTLQTKVAGGDYAAVSIGPWSNYTNLAQNGYFKDLSPFLDEVPALCEAYGGKEELLKLSIDGRGLCYIPQRASAANSNGFWYRKDLCDKWEIAPVTDLESLNAYLYAAKEEFGRPMIYSPDVMEFIGSMFMNGTGIGVGPATTLQNDPYTVVVSYELPEYKAAMEQAAQWYNDGITSPDVMNSNALPDVGNELMAGTLPCHFANHLASGKANFIPQAMAQLNVVDGAEDTEGANPNGIEFDFMPYMTEDAVLYETNNGNTTGWAINAKCSDEEAVALLKFIEAAHTDIEFYDAYQYGKEGLNYASISDDGGRYISYENIDSGKRMYRKLATGLTDEILMRRERMQYASLEELFQVKEGDLSDKLVPNPLNGFIFDTSKVENQVMAVNEALSQTASYRAGIIGNMTVDDAIQDMLDKCYDAGLQDIIDELNAQIAAYREKNGI